MSNILEEVKNLALIQAETLALIKTALEQAEILSPDFQPVLSEEGKRFVMRPDNFITFEICHKRVNHVRISMRGNHEEFREHNELPLKNGRAGYSEFLFKRPDQSHAATDYIKQARSIYAGKQPVYRHTPETVLKQQVMRK